MTSLDVVAIGESLGLLVPDRPGRLAHVPHLRLGFGGAESNVAIGVARLGGRSAASVATVSASSSRGASAPRASRCTPPSIRMPPPPS
jgi:sugar/nucleoside kinase (ribokinase family)